MYSVESVLPIFEALDGAALTPGAFSKVCKAAGWPEPIGDNIGLWEVEHPEEGTPLILDTVTTPTTLICRLACDDEYEPDALLDTPLRRSFDDLFQRAAATLKSRFAFVGEGRSEPPFDWRYAHFQGVNACIALEQSYCDPIMGVQLLLLFQPASAVTAQAPITADW